MKKNNFLISLIFFMLASNYIIAQQKPNVTKIKELINNLYFEIPIYEQKFEVKLVLRGSENFYGYKEFNFNNIESVSCGFEENNVLKYLGYTNEITVFFDKQKKIEYILITSDYQLNDGQKAEMQYLDLIDILYDISYEAYVGDVSNGEKEVIGKSVALYASSLTVKNKKPYLYISFQETPRNSYQFSALYYPNRLK